MATTETGASAAESSEKKGEDHSWKREFPSKYLAAEDTEWNNNDFLPKCTSEEYVDQFRELYRTYFRQIVQSDGFDFDVYPGDAKAAVYVPYLDFENEIDMLTQLANHAIEEYNNNVHNVYKYRFSYFERVNFLLAECREFFMTLKVDNITLRTPLQTFQIHAYKGPHGENVVRVCRRKTPEAEAEVFMSEMVGMLEAAAATSMRSQGGKQGGRWVG